MKGRKKGKLKSKLFKEYSIYNIHRCGNSIKKNLFKNLNNNLFLEALPLNCFTNLNFFFHKLSLLSKFFIEVNINVKIKGFNSNPFKI